MISITIPTIKPRNELSVQVSQIQVSLSDYQEGKDFEIIIQSAKQSATKNRNQCCYLSKGDYIIQCDDDIEQFPKNWAFDLIKYLDNDIRIISARLMTPDMKPATMISFRGNINDSQHIWINKDGLMPSACWAFSRETWEGIMNNKKLLDDKPFDENIPRACCDDSTFCMAMALTFPGAKVAVNNRVKVIHRCEEKWRTNKESDWQWNHGYFRKRFGRDPF